MLKGDDFVGACENHIVVAYDGAAADSGDADFTAVALLAFLASVVYIVVSSVRSLVDRVSQGQGGTAGSIQLLIVVLFYDLDIKSGCRQSRSRLL